jgi:autotransporter-associated beta strand protein
MAHQFTNSPLNVMKQIPLIPLTLTILISMAPPAPGHGVTVNVDLNAAGTKLVVDRPVYADRDITAITAIDQSLGYEQDDDVPGFEFSSRVQALGGVVSLRVVEPTHLWNPANQLQAQTNASVVLDSLFYFVPPAGNIGPMGESVAGQTSISSTLPVVLFDPAAPPSSDHHFAVYDLTTGAAQSDPSVGAYGLVVEIVDVTAGGTIASAPFIIGLDNGLTHSESSFGPGGDGDHQQPANDGTQYGAAVGAFQGQLANTVVWNYNGGGKYSEAAKWDGNPLQGPGNAGTTILLANGSTTAVNASSAVVTVDGAYTAGALIFDNISGTTYTLAGDGVSGHGLTLNNNGAGASVNVVGGNHTIAANVTLAEPTVFNVASGSSLLITSGQIGESTPSTPIYLTGGGTLMIDSSSSYSGATTINGGTLQTTSHGTISPGPLTLNTDNYIASTVAIGNNQSVASLAATGDGSGTATVTVDSGRALTVQQPIVLAAATMLHVSGGGKLRLAPVAGSAMVGAGSTVAIAADSTLELGGSVSALSADANVRNDGSQTTGGALLITGITQQLGSLDGSGDLVIRAGGMLTANHVIQAALVIDGAPSDLGLLTIAPSDLDGEPALMPPLKLSGLGGVGPTVPEPPTVWLALIGLTAVGCHWLANRKRRVALASEAQRSRPVWSSG